jgi:ribosomal protein L40E
VVYELQAFSRRVIEAEYCQNNKMDMTDSQKTALKLKEFCTKDGKLNGDLLSLIALGTAKENKLSNGGQQYVLGKKGEDGKTIRNSRQLYMRQLYEEAGVYDDILKAVESGEFEYADFGLSKTVVKQSEDKSKANYQDIYNKTMSKSNGSKTSGRKAKNSSSKKISGGSLKGGGSASKLTQAKFSPAKNANLNFFKAYQNTFNQKRGTKVSKSGSSSQVCPNCGARVSANASRCPNCGAKL